MKNLMLIKSDPPRIYEADSGAPIEFYNLFTQYLWNERGLSYAPESVTAMEKCGRVFTEFLFEAGVLSFRLDAATASQTMSLYSSYLLDGAAARDPIIRAIAIRTGRKPILRGSARQYIAGANLMLKVTSAISSEAAELRSILLGEEMAVASQLPELNPRTRSQQEMEHIHANTLQVKPNPPSAGRSTAGGLRSPRGSKTRTAKHIAERHILPMFDNAPSPLDGLIWAMGSAAGLRLSEIVGVKQKEIKPSERTFYVHDPKGLRDISNKPSTDKNSFGFKGRQTAAVTMFEPFKSIFWKKLAEYLAVRPRSDSDLLLLSLDEHTYGTPLYELTANSVNRAVNRQIQATQARLGLSPDRKYSSHDFRHLYGIWGRNYVWVPGRPKPGLDLAEMQLNMGHASSKSTEIYAQDLNLNILIEIDAANELIYYKDEGESIDHYRGQVYARLAAHMQDKGDAQ